MTFASFIAPFLEMDEDDPRIRLYESDLEGFKALMRIFSRSEIDGVRRVLYTLSKDLKNPEHVAYKMSHSSLIIFNSLKSRRPDLFTNTVDQRVRNTGKYKNWVTAVKVRDGYKCKVCNSESDLQVHHIKSVKEYPDLITKLDNGVTLCSACHNKAHTVFSDGDLQFFLNRGNES